MHEGQCPSRDSQEKLNCVIAGYKNTSGLGLEGESRNRRTAQGGKSREQGGYLRVMRGMGTAVV